MQILTKKAIVLRITIIIALVELVIMLALGNLHHELDYLTTALFDTVSLIILSTPLIYLWVVKPNIDARDAAQKEILHLAMHDPLTGLANSRLINEYLDRMIANLCRHRIYGALLLIDLDDFKPINDNCGHEAGDEALTGVATRLQSIIRTEDIVGRLGGDEFVVLLGQLDGDERAAHNKATEKAAKLQEIIHESFECNGRSFKVSASIGIRVLGCEKTEANKVLKEADQAMYRAKQSGKGNYVVFDNRDS